MSRLLPALAFAAALVAAPALDAQAPARAGVERPRAGAAWFGGGSSREPLAGGLPGRAAGQRRPLWPWFALGGAALGAGAAAAWVLSSCDAGCRDDGGQALGMIIYVPVGAAAGALVGVILGRAVEARR
jgi:hypothetical protein